MSINELPHLNASLNATACVLLILGYVQIKRSRVKSHVFFMLASTMVSALFLLSYLIYHFNAVPVKYLGEHRVFYFFTLISHILCAIIVPVLVIKVLYHAKNQDWFNHKKWAKILWPIWLYTSITGVMVYLFLYN